MDVCPNRIASEGGDMSSLYIMTADIVLSAHVFNICSFDNAVHGFRLSDVKNEEGVAYQIGICVRWYSVFTIVNTLEQIRNVVRGGGT